MKSENFQVLMLPFLEYLKDGTEHSLKEIQEELTKFVELTDENLKPFDLVSGEQEFIKAIPLAHEHLTKAGLVEYKQNGKFKITAMGKMVLSKRLNSLDVKYLRMLPGYH